MQFHKNKDDELFFPQIIPTHKLVMEPSHQQLLMMESLKLFTFWGPEVHLSGPTTRAMWKYKIDFNMKTLLSHFNFEIENVNGFLWQL
jgi:hypothetical protein